MEYWFEIYFDFENLEELGFREEKVYWGGEELSQDPVTYLSDNGFKWSGTLSIYDRIRRNLKLPSGVNSEYKFFKNGKYI